MHVSRKLTAGGGSGDDGGETQALYRSVVAAMSEGVVIQNAGGAIEAFNASALDILGLTEGELLGRTSRDPRWRAVREDGSDFPGEEHPAMVTLRTGEGVRGVLMGLHTPAGEERWIRINSEPVAFDAEGRVQKVVATFADVTVERETLRRLEAAAAAAERANEAKSAFLANMSHEIRTPLNGVVGLTDALARTPLSEAQQEMLSLVQESATTLERVLSDVLDMSKIESGRLEIERAPFELKAAVEAAAGLMAATAREKGLAFETRFGAGADGRVLGDAARLKQILSNLVSNAVKFTETGGVVVAVDLADGEPALLTVEVEDTGVGIDEAAAERLFDRFTQADSSITRRFGGSGLGLAISRNLARRMGGDLTARARPGGGSVFRLTLPLERAEAPAASSAPEVRPGAAERAAGLRVLLAEDHPVNQRVVEYILAPCGVDLVVVADGRAAVDACRQARFDAILMDMQMPVMDGLSAAREIRRLEAEAGAAPTPMAMLSANAMTHHVREADEAGCDLHIAKPVTAETLLSGLEALLARRSA